MIISNVPDLIYTGNIKNQVSIEKLKSFFIRYNIPLVVIKKLIKKLCPCAKNPSVICKIQLNEFEFDDQEEDDNSEQTDDEEEVSENDSSDDSDDGSELDI